MRPGWYLAVALRSDQSQSTHCTAVFVGSGLGRHSVRSGLRIGDDEGSRHLIFGDDFGLNARRQSRPSLAAISQKTWRMPTGAWNCRGQGMSRFHCLQADSHLVQVPLRLAGETRLKHTSQFLMKGQYQRERWLP